MPETPQPDGSAVPPASGARLVWRAISRNRRRLVLSYPLLIGWQLGESLVPIVIGAVVDRGIATGDTHAFVLWMLVLAGLFAVLSLAYRYGSRQGFRSVREEEHRLRLEVSRHLIDPAGARSTMPSGEVLSLATSDALLVGSVVRQVGYTVASVTAVLVVAVYLFSVHAGLALLVLLGMPVVLLVTQLFTPLVARRTLAQQGSIAAASGVATDLVQGLRPLKGIAGEQAAAAAYRQVSQEASRATIGMARSMGYLTGLTTGLAGLFLAMVTLVAGRLALNGDISLGQLIAVVGLTQYLAEPITSLGELSAQAAASLASGRRIADFLHAPRLLRGGPRRVPDAHPTLALYAVCSPSLRGLSLILPPGSLVGVVVDDPAASQDLVGILTGELEPESGRLELGGIPLRDLDIRDLRRHLVVNPHHTELFEGTLRTAVDPTAALEPHHLEAVLVASAADEVADSQAGGLEHPVRARGVSLSGGQRQRLALARALATGAPVLVLEEPTSAVDSVTEHRIAGQLREVRGPGATLVITTSPALLTQADRVLLLADGQVVAQGTHHDLLTRADYRAVVLR